MALASFGIGCSQIVGFGDVSLGKPVDDANVDGPTIDTMTIDTPGPPPKLWVFVTDAGFAGGFGVPNGARATADIKCQDMYNATFTARSCTSTNIHAVLQIDDTVDSLARMDITFPIPQTSEVLRATDATPVVQDWDTLVNPNASLAAPVVGGTTAVPFWSGRGTTCSSWTSSAATVRGIAGNANVTNAWMVQGDFTCNNFNQHLLCICW